jgi:hypothetical protein
MTLNSMTLDISVRHKSCSTVVWKPVHSLVSDTVPKLSGENRTQRPQSEQALLWKPQLSLVFLLREKGERERERESKLSCAYLMKQLSTIHLQWLYSPLLARKADNFTAICEPIVEIMWDSRRLTTLWAVTVCYRDSFTALCWALASSSVS